MPVDPSLTQLIVKLTTIHHLKDACAVLSWDQETYMPTGSGQARAEQIATLQTLAHESFVSPEMERLLGEWVDLETGETTSQFDDTSRAFLHETWRDFNRAKKLPSKFVNSLERECSLAQQVWAKAREKNSFSSFLPNLRRIIALKLEETEYLGYEDSPYDALLDEYEPASTVKKLQPLFQRLRSRLISLLDRVLNASVRPNTTLLTQSYDQAKQLEFGKRVLNKMGYDFHRGRMDQSAHPFTTAFHPHDVRVTTRVFEQDFQSCLFSCIHEGGHGLYEQGLPAEHYGTVLGESVSLGIHESQSRLWENCVGRSQPFWQYFFPQVQEDFPDQFGHIGLDEFFLAINQASPSLIRVEADELTYNLHVMVRFEIELDLIQGQIQAEDLPAMWNEKMQKYLGMTPDSDANGVLQDVHWSFGAFGYFPTYTLGNLYASMFYEQAKNELLSLEADIATGHLLPLKEWLNQKIHRWGRRHPPDELVRQVTGQLPTPEPFLNYLESKFSKLYGFSMDTESSRRS